VIGEFKTYARLSGDKDSSAFASALEEGYQSGGWKGACRKNIEISVAQRKTGYGSPYNIALLYADLADKEHAFEWLNIAYLERDSNLLGLKTDFLADSLRSDPRYADLVRRIGLP
jgi:hypothetical protein